MSAGMIEAALAYVAAGLRIFPTHWPVSDGNGGLRCSYGSPHTDDSRAGKHPRVDNWPNVATTDPAQITAWWTEWPEANIGVLTGAANGITVIDIDPRNGGREEWDKHLRRHQPMPLPPGILAVETGSGGDHIYLQHIQDVETSHSVVGPGIDIQADGAYILGVGSLHISGKRYEVALGGKPQPAPVWLVELLQSGSRGRKGQGGRRRKNGRTQVEQLRWLLGTIEDGGNDRDGAMASVAGMLWHDGIAEDRLRPLVEEWAARHLNGKKKTATDFNRVVSSIKNYERDPTAHLEVDDVDEYLKAKLERAKADDLYVRRRGEIIPDLQHNIRHAFDRLGVSLSYDEFDDQFLIEGPDDKPRRPLTDAESSALWFTIDEDKRCRFRPKKEFFRDFVEHEARKGTFHPVRDYLDGFQISWDNLKRIDTWLITYGGAKDTLLNRAIGRIVLIAAVRRIRQPGAKFDEMLTLIGGQGSERSTMLSTLAVRPEWFSDTLDLGAKQREMMEQLAGVWIVEAAELVGMRSNNIHTVKAQLSRQMDRARRAYGHFSERRSRQCVVIGTSNEELYLHDTTGNRRHWPVVLGTCDINRLREDRDQLWAEAALAEAAGESIRLAKSLWEAAAKVQAAHMVHEPWMDLIDRVIGDRTGRIEAEALWMIVNVPKDRRTQKDNDRIGGAMRRLGWQYISQQKHHGRRPTAYAKGTPEQRKVWLLVDEAGRCEPEPESQEPRQHGWRLRIVGDEDDDETPF